VRGWGGVNADHDFFVPHHRVNLQRIGHLREQGGSYGLALLCLYRHAPSLLWQFGGIGTLFLFLSALGVIGFPILR
jgi:hypothetical protein